MLRKIRTILAILTFAAITLLLLDFTGTLHQWLGWLAKIQFLPAVLAMNFVVVAVIVVLTLVLGRIYCSVVCPLGVMQDVISWIHGKTKKNRFTYSKEKRWLRYGVLVVFIAAMVLGVGSLVALLAPYSSYGRIVMNLFRPLYELGNNALAALAEHYDSYAFYKTDVWIRSLPTFIIAAVTFVVLVVLAWRGGRTYCNTICPVGTVLSFLARFSWLKIRFDEEKCRNCSKCTKNCKAACIDFRSHTVDYSRCVVCGDCIDQCKFGALQYRPGRPTSCKKGQGGGSPEGGPASRRSFLVASAVATTTIALAQEKKKVDGGLAVIEDKQAPERVTPLTPPGSLSAKNMATRCTACQLCVSECPNGVLRPSTDFMTLMQPTMSYERGYCRPECTRCSDVCPTGAIRPITKDEKASTQIGHAVWLKDNCVCVTDDMDCGNCERHCPTGAIQMVPLVPDDEYSVYIPTIDETRCIGCGACENLCPARPFSAIYVEGHEQHKTI
jgi:ferredoxin